MTCKLGQSDLVFGVQSKIISK